MKQPNIRIGDHLVTATKLQGSTLRTSAWIKNLYTNPDPVFLLTIQIRSTECVSSTDIWHTPEQLDALIANLQAHREHIKTVQTELIALQSAPQEQAA